MTTPSLVPPADAALWVEGVRVGFAGREILRDVSFTLGGGQLTALIGANGAGKTTLFRVILGLQSSGGRVAVAGDERGRGTVGYVPQQISFDRDLPLRARDVVALGLDGHRLGIPLARKRRQERVDEMLAAVGAEALADARVGTLSGGEQQRVLVAHALISRPALLLLDEPLANLDLRAEQEVVELLDRVTREQSVAVLVSAHDMNPLLPVMDLIVYIAEGRTVSGTVDEVVRSEVLSALYGHHVDVLEVHGRVIVVAGPAPTEPPPADDLAAPTEPGIVSIR